MQTLGAAIFSAVSLSAAAVCALKPVDKRSSAAVGRLALAPGINVVIRAIGSANRPLAHLAQYVAPATRRLLH